MNEETPVALPSALARQVSQNVRIQAPLSRRGFGPALILIVPGRLDLRGSSEFLDPPPLQKWAEEGFVVAQLTLPEIGITFSPTLEHSLTQSIEALLSMKECEPGKIGVVGKYTPTVLIY